MLMKKERKIGGPKKKPVTLKTFCIRVRNGNPHQCFCTSLSSILRLRGRGEGEPFRQEKEVKVLEGCFGSIKKRLMPWRTRARFARF